jgi:hypothetical protein
MFPFFSFLFTEDRSTAEGNDTYGTTFLLAPIIVVREFIVRADMIELGCWLIIPGRKSFSAVHSNDGALVRRNEHDLRIVWVDQDTMIIVTTRRTPESRPRGSNVNRFPGHYIRAIYNVFVFRVYFDLCDITFPASVPRIRLQFLPAFAGIIAGMLFSKPRRC